MAKRRRMETGRNFAFQAPHASGTASVWGDFRPRLSLISSSYHFAASSACCRENRFARFSRPTKSAFEVG